MRKPMVTRAFKATKLNVLCLDTNSCEPENKVITIAGTFEDAKKALKAAQKVIDTEEYKAVKIVDSEEVETLYGMDVNKFIAEAVVLDPETRKMVEEVKAD